jgi:hypothetical protein
MEIDFGPGFHAPAGRPVDTDAYERYIGRWSRLFVPALLAAAEVTVDDHVLDVAHRLIGRYRNRTVVRCGKRWKHGWQNLSIREESK